MEKFELKRQLFHAFLGLGIVALLKYGIINKEIILAVLIIGIILSSLSRNMKIPIIHQLLQEFEREKELKAFPGKGIILYIAGVYITSILFSKDIALASIMILALGDSVSHLFGLHFGKIKHPLSKTKFLEGTVAGFAFGFIGALFFVRPVEAFLASLIAMIFEAVEIKIGAEQVDDNLIIPVVAGAVVWVVRLL